MLLVLHTDPAIIAAGLLAAAAAGTALAGGWLRSRRPDAGNNGVITLADKMLPPREHGVLMPGRRLML